MVGMDIAHIHQLVSQSLQNAGASVLQAESTAKALVTAECQGLVSHGVSRVTMYAGHLRAGRVSGQAIPKTLSNLASALLVDAGDGFAFPACELAVREAIDKAKATGIAIGAVTNSHHFGVAAYHLEPVANAGLVGIAMGNSPAAMPAAGGKRALMGTNPMAAVFPRLHAPPVMIDLSLSEVARGKLMIAAKKGDSIPLGWALDKNGQPTTDPKAGLEGSMLPFGSTGGGTKGAMLALMVELMVISLTGARFGMEADSFFEEQGNQPRIGQVFIVIDPAALGGQPVYAERVESLLSAMLDDEGVRIPGYRRAELASQTLKQGLNLPEATLEALLALAKVT
jgi:(2R)-3-sulfolactate dehydrogenase (NADP+)